MDRKLTPTEDADLRRLQELTRYAISAPNLLDRCDELRARDRRASVRDVASSELARMVWDDDTE